MFTVVEVKQYDSHSSYGTDWHTDYYIESDEQLDIDRVIDRLTNAGHNVYGECTLTKTNNGYKLQTIMY